MIPRTARRRIHLALSVAWGLTSPALAAEDPVEALRSHVTFLASPGLEGRLTGSEGERLAADYLAAELQKIGARPLPGLESYLVPFEFTAGTNDAGSSLVVQAAGGQAGTWRGEDQVRALSFSDNGSATGEVVFAGYGLSVPESQDLSYDSFVNLDVRDKIVLVLRYFPEDTQGELRDGLARYSGLRYKALAARERGAKALIVATGPRSPNAGTTVDMTFDAALSGAGILAGSVSGAVAASIFESVPGRTLEQVQRSLDSGNPHVAGFSIPGLSLTLDVKVARERRTGRNVVAYLPPEPAPEAGASPRTHVLAGAHYDHLGRGRHGNSLAKKDEVGQVHHGADDNASGVAALLQAARKLGGVPRQRPVVMAFWSGEELGLLGATDFIKSARMPADRIAAYVNLDMVGRMRDNRLNLQAAASSPVWPRLIEQANVAVGFDVRTQADPYLPTDSAALYQAGVPTLNLFTGSHENYHRPSDTADTVNYDDLARVAEFTALLLARLANLEQEPEYVKVEPKLEARGQRDSVRAYTGTIPDYTTEVDGVRLSGVVGGGPADRAGLREGDVIVEFAGRRITNIYDYTYALDAVKIDQPTEVVLVRDGERLRVTITPGRRP